MKYNFRNYFIIFITLLLTSAVFNNLKAVTENEAFLGDKEAKVTIIEYASMTCNHCADFHREIYPKIKEKYIDSKKIKFIYRDFPLDKQALYASILAKCAPEDKYFDFVKLILSTQSKWISNDDSFVEKLTNIGKLAGLNEEKITNCFSD